MPALYGMIIGMAISIISIKAFFSLMESCEDWFGFVLAWAGVLGFFAFVIFLSTINIYYYFGFAIGHIPLIIIEALTCGRINDRLCKGKDGVVK